MFSEAFFILKIKKLNNKFKETYTVFKMLVLTSTCSLECQGGALFVF